MLDIRSYVEERIAALEKIIAEDKAAAEASHGEKIDFNFSFYDKGIWEGEPYAYGNYTDTYDEGFDNGCSQGELNTLKTILTKLDDK